MASHIEATREEEKKRIARELHDDLGQQLTALKMGLTGLAAESREASMGAGQGTVQAMSEAIDRAIVSVRRLAAGLRPTILDDFGLLSALEWLADDFRQRSGLHVELHFENVNVEFNDTASTALFRIVQEGLTNIARHARAATEVQIDVQCGASMCDLSIQDNGAPVQPAARQGTGAPRSSGLAGIRDRVRRLGGTVTTGPLPDRGFAIRLSIPRGSIECASPQPSDDE
ncbi:sensor histidine kinase [Paraburkholderia kururiensis]|uniref:sensor histidine kinase n=1 Tax=Paraburkholderia kururiensis TaxID=984307 RepID=UPI0039A6B6FB